MRFYDKHDAEDAVEEMDGTKMDGKAVVVSMARYPRAGGKRGMLQYIYSFFQLQGFDV